MRLHILGIGGTFMAGVALLARALGYEVAGSDGPIYPPMSDQLAAAGITVCRGYEPAHLDPAPDQVIIGNALARGNPAVEHVLDRGLPYTSGAEWVAEEVLRRTGTHAGRARQDAGPEAGRWVLAVAGTHGKTTTASLLAWILEQAGLNPGFLIGGVPENFGMSARLTDSPFFVIEADEYDTAFFDKRSKFVHYRPRTAVFNNLEYDHADIFPDLESIQRQFHHLVRTVPASGLLVVNGQDPNLNKTLALGCWTPVERFSVAGSGENAPWQAEALDRDASRFRVLLEGRPQGEVHWDLIGAHNMTNALAALAAARHAGVPVAQALRALSSFRNVKRRLEVRGRARGVTVYDDFAHHPTAIAATLGALRARAGRDRIWAVLEPRSNTMRLGVHRHELAPSLAAADAALIYRPADLSWDLSGVAAELGGRGRVFDQVGELIEVLARETRPGDHVLVMSNGGFENLHARLLDRLGV